MDLNKALSAHQLALIRASDTPNEDRREHLLDVADQLADHIALRQDTWGAPCAHLLPAARL
jgi:hypothetical protein